jgi:glycosyltransferase involved in cell wall biosynthesis
MLDEVRRRQDEFDIIHFHTDLVHFPLFEAIAPRTITSLHGRLDLIDLPEVYRRWAKYPLVSISDCQRIHLHFANWVGTVHHGISGSLFGLSETSRGYLAFLGRISPEKGPDRAIAIAKRVGTPLKIAAKVDAADAPYFETCIRPLLDDPLIEFIGEIGDDAKAEFLGGAEALLFPIIWPEPFGLVMIEAMACGTPVVAYRQGAAIEVVDEGVTGFLVEDEQQAALAITRARALDRREVRRRFERRFSATTMAHGYLDLYAERLARWSGAPEPAPDRAASERRDSFAQIA